MYEPARVEERERRGDVAQHHAQLAEADVLGVAQVAAVEDLHRVERPVLVDAVVVGLDDPRMTEARERVELTAEAQLRAASSLLEARHALQRDGATVRDVDRAVHHAHAPAAELLLDAVAVADEASGGIERRSRGSARHRDERRQRLLWSL